MKQELGEQPDFHYPREEAEALVRGLHPHEARPRSGTSFLGERDAWQASVDALQAHSDELRDGVRELLGRACGLMDGLWGWYWRCRHCDGRSPDKGLKHEALEGDIEHKPGCVVPRMRELTTLKVTRR